MEWSSYQTAIFSEAARETQDDCAVVARAGSGKTSSLIESLRSIPYSRTLLCAFNKSIQTEMEKRAPSYVTTRTMHSLGLRLHQMNLAHRGSKRAQVDAEKARRMAMALLKEKRHYWLPPSGQDDFGVLLEACQNVRKTAAYAKNVLASEHEQLVGIAATLCDLDSTADTIRVARAAAELMERAADEPYQVDFDDMVWFPARFGYGEAAGTEMLRFDAILIDERQDVNAAQHWMVERMRRGGRVISFLDDRQTLYAFRGADRAAIQQALSNPSSVRLSLPISYRCPVAVIEKAQEVVPDIQPAPNAVQGSVTLHEYTEMIEEAEPGDFILSRTNAPLMATCIKLLKLSKPAVIAGRDLCESLIRLVTRSKAGTIAELVGWLHDWTAKEKERHVPDHPERYERSRDRAACLFVLSRDCHGVSMLREKLRQLFGDAEQDELIVCSTVHRAKGLERDCVWVLRDTFGYPDPKPWQDRWSEENIWYVAVTRARRQLRSVETPIDEILYRPPQPTTSTRRKRQVVWR